ncbi:ABC transporter permease [Flindersiella endophytica]
MGPRRQRWQTARRHWQMYAFVLPGLVVFVVFAYVPLLGNVAAFQDYSPFLGFSHSPWAGLDNFTRVLADPDVLHALTNTLELSLIQILFAFPAPIALALLLNSIVTPVIRRWLQSIVYLPHFISWVIVISIWQQVLGGAGPIAGVLAHLGFHDSNLMSNPDLFPALVTAQVIWKDSGWGTIIFFAALTTIPAELYESAAMDGACAWRRMWHVTLPGLVPVISLLLVLRLGDVLSVGFEQIYLQYNSVGPDAAEVVDTFVYFRGVVGSDWGMSTAVGLLKGVIGTVLVLTANRVSKRLGAEGLF